MQALQSTELVDVLLQVFVIPLLGMVERLDVRRPLAELDLGVRTHTEVLCIDFHPFVIQHQAAALTSILSSARVRSKARWRRASHGR